MTNKPVFLRVLNLEVNKFFWTILIRLIGRRRYAKQRSSYKGLNTDAQDTYSWARRHGIPFFINISWSSARALGHELGKRMMK